MEQGQLLKRIRVWILRYLQFRRLIWWLLFSFIVFFYIGPTPLRWLLIAILWVAAALLYMHAICPVCNKHVHREVDSDWDPEETIDGSLGILKRKSCVHCGYSFSKEKKASKDA